MAQIITSGFFRIPNEFDGLEFRRIHQFLLVYGWILVIHAQVKKSLRLMIDVMV